MPGTGDSHPDTKDRDRGSHRRPRTEEITGCPEPKACHGAKHLIPKFPASLPSQGPVLGTVPHVPLEPHILHQASVSSTDLQAGDAASCSLSKA